jgi:hypothetical protein
MRRVPADTVAFMCKTQVRLPRKGAARLQIGEGVMRMPVTWRAS